MTKTCTQCQTSFDITPEEQKFRHEISPIIAGKPYSIPDPLLCPDCRQTRRMAFRNESTLFKRNCDSCKKSIISTYSTDKPFPVFCQECFWSDQWNALDHGRDFDFTRPFFDQFRELLEKVPRLCIMNKQSENSDYCNYSFANKNCYLTFGSHYEEDCLYSHYSTKNKNCVDCYLLSGSELCYEVICGKTCYRSIFLDHCENAQECFFSVDLVDSKNCIFSSNLRHKQYMILNQQYSKEEYFKKLESFAFGDAKRFEEAKQFFRTDFRKRFPFRAFYESNCEDCSGNNNHNSKNLRNCFYCSDCEDCSYGYLMDNTFSSMDMNCMGYDRCERCYNTIGCTAVTNLLCCDSCWQSSDLMYCNLCFSSQNLFGCIGLYQKKYCILNKQYTKEEYEDLVVRIIGGMQGSALQSPPQAGEGWGEFFPPAISPYQYEETIAHDYFPSGEKKMQHAASGKTISPDVMSCVDCARQFKLVPLEIRFYQDLQIPPPQQCSDCRRKERIRLMLPRKLWPRSCAKCQKPIQTSYSKERPEIVYCERCYLETVY